uniref:Vacuolar ATPase assembly protein VMA22 n=1 Tax=Esox lucius TaxID=8010 RepID=A0A6Q2YJ37_ESOLU
MGPTEKKASVLLDKKLLVFMDQLELLEEKREKLNSLIEQGWFFMSKARYSMGNKQVSALQYGNEMEPLVRVNTRYQGETLSYYNLVNILYIHYLRYTIIIYILYVCMFYRRLESGEAAFQTDRNTQTTPEEKPLAEKLVEDIGPKDTEGLRRRTQAKKVLTTEEGGQSATETELLRESDDMKPPPSSKLEHNPQQNPLRWFGVLVPQTLKQAQVSFRQVIELSAEVAALQSAVLATRKQLQQQMMEKNSPQTEGQ